MATTAINKDRVPDHYKTLEANKRKHAAEKLSKHLSDSAVLSSLYKFLKGLTTIADKAFKELDLAVNRYEKLTTSLTLTISVIKFFGIFSSLAKVVDAAKEVKRHKERQKDISQPALKVTAAVLGVIIGGTAGVNIAEFMDFIKTSKIIGKIPVIGTKVANVFPFSSIVATIETIKAVFEVTISARSLHKLQKTEKELKEHKRNWKGNEIASLQDKINKAEEDPYRTKTETLKEEKDYLVAKIAKIEGKLYGTTINDEGVVIPNSKTNKDEESPARLVEKSRIAYLEIKENYKDYTRLGKLKSYFSLIKAKNKFKADSRRVVLLKERAGKYTKDLNTVVGKIHKRESDIELYKKICTLYKSQDDLVAKNKNLVDELEIISSKKIEKWSLKLLHNRDHQAKEIRSIAFNTALIVVLVASIMLAATGVGAVAASILLGVGFLFITGFALTNHLIGKPRDPRWKPVRFEVPSFEVSSLDSPDDSKDDVEIEDVAGEGEEAPGAPTSDQVEVAV